MTVKRPFYLRLLGALLKRPVQIDSDLPIGVIVGHGITTAIGFLRGILLARRPMVLGPGARIVAPQHLRVAGGLVRVGSHCRVDCTSRDGIELGQNFKLGAFSHVIASGTLANLGKGIVIGDNVGIGEFAYLGGAGGLRIGSDVIVGQYFSTHPENHVFADQDVPIREQGVTRKGIDIGSDCWIGAKVTVLDGVSLGRGCVVAAGSVVTRSFPDNAIIGGVPAKILKMRGTKHSSKSCNNGEKADGTR
jgi:acetyltransferase-like isoleucine patch superfamily enzyme